MKKQQLSYKACDFSQKMTKKAFSMINKNLILNILNNNQEWVINQQKFTSQKWDQIFPLMETMTGKKIILDWNKQANILHSIIHINFVNLKQINFGANYIVSLEIIFKLNAPNLKELGLCNNLISNFSSLRKAYFPSLSILDIFNNTAVELSSLTQLFSKNLFKISIQMTSVHKVMNENMVWLIKAQPSSISWIWCKSKKRIKQSKIIITLEKIKKSKGFQN